MKKNSIIIIFLFCMIPLKSQKVENIRMSVEGDKIIVLYDIIKYSEDFLYNIEIYFQSTTKITPFALSGDVGEKVLGGRNRKIVWDLYQDIDGLSGNLKAVVGITGKTRIKHLGGPGNMLYSLAIPGLGDYFVKGNKLRPIITHTVFYGSLAAAYYYYDKAGSEYNNYKYATTQETIDDYYRSVEQLQQSQNMYLFLAGTIWLQDITHVIIRGTRNNKIHPYKGGRATYVPTALIYPANGGAQLSLTFNF